MKSILITGFFGEGNLGDEAILSAICEILPKEITPIITSNSKHNFGKDIRRRGLLSYLPFIKASIQSPITIFTGGILQDWSWEGVTFFAHRIILAAKMGSTPVLFGTGIGPLRSEKAKKLVKKALSFVKIAYVRDKTSFDLYKSLLPNANVYLGTDWTWHFPIEEKKIIKKENNKIFGINLRQWKNETLLNNAISQINNFKGEKIGLIARRSDISLIEKLDNVSQNICPTNFIDFAQKCENLTYGIAMRYHAALAMLRSGLPTKLVCYDSKVKDLAIATEMKLDKDNISIGFNKPSNDFICKNKLLYKKMENSFLELLFQYYGESKTNLIYEKEI